MIHIVHLHYQQPLSEVEKHVGNHRKFLDRGYASGLFLASGPLDPKTGGIILATGDLKDVKKLLEEDPYYTNDIAAYEYMSFNPVKHQDLIAQCLK